MKTILLTFDVEEFDLPLELNQPMTKEQIFEIPKQGLISLLNLLDKYKISATFFTTATFAKKHSGLIKQMSKKHEIACHGYEHSDSYIKDISKIQSAKEEIEKIIKKNINGFRAPRFEIKDIHLLPGLGFSYDSSIHPTIIPGRYMNAFKERTAHRLNDITEIPLSVLPIIRLPIFWLAFKDFPLVYSKAFTKINFISDNYTMLLSHPWEFVDLSEFKIPFYIKMNTGQTLLNKLEDYIKFCKKQHYTFSTIGDFLSQQFL